MVISKNNKIILFTLMLSCLLLASAYWSEAHAIRVSMKRIVFEDRQRSDTITIINNSAQDETYRIGWRRFYMTEENALVHTDDDSDGAKGVKWAEKLLKYSPRRVKVPAGGTQQIRVMLRKPSKLETGEYRAHIWITTEDKAAEFDPNANVGAAEGKQSVEVRMKPGLTLPIIVRHGKLDSAVSIVDAKFVKGSEVMDIEFTIQREGGRSLYGDIVFKCLNGGSETYVRQLRGLAVYPEINKRRIKSKVKYPEGGSAQCAQLKVQYRATREDSFYNGSIMAEAIANPVN